MSVVARVLRFALVLALLASFAAQARPAAADTSRMAALHAKAMQTMEHDMSAMAKPAKEAGETPYPGVMNLCKQHCTAVAVVLPTAPTPPAVSARAAKMAWPAPVIFVSTKPVPTGPPPKFRSA